MTRGWNGPGKPDFNTYILVTNSLILLLNVNHEKNYSLRSVEKVTYELRSISNKM